VNLGVDANLVPHTAQDIAAGSGHTCALLEDFSVKCWGLNNVGQLGDGDMLLRGADALSMGDALPAVDLGLAAGGSGPGWRHVVGISAGGNHNCVILSDNSVECWGENAHGELGYGDTANRGSLPADMGLNLHAVSLGASFNAAQLSLADGVSCALGLQNSTVVKCWGNNFNGQLGQGDTNNRGDQAGEMGDNLLPIDLGTSSPSQISAGVDHVCANITTPNAAPNQFLQCWGDNTYGQLGDGLGLPYGAAPGTMGANLPLIDLNGAGFIDVATGTSHTCVLLAESNASSSSSVACFGINTIGQLGLGDTANRGASALTMGLGLGLSLSPSRTYFPVSDNNGTLTAATLTNVMVGVPHTFRMLAGNAAGNSQWSLGTTVMMVGTATAPTSVSVLRRTGSSITLLWTSPADPGSPITDYKVQTSTNGTTWTDYVPVAPIGVNTQVEVTGLTSGVTTYFRIAALNAIGLGDWSTVINSVAMDRPAAPVAPIVTDVQNNSALVSWTAPADNGSSIVDYVVEYRQAISGSGWEAPINVPAPATSTTISGLVPNLQYEVRVTARNHAAIDPTQLASSDPSSLTQFTTKVGAPVVSSITLSVSGLSPYTSNARFAWSAPAPNGGAGAIGSYTVQYRLHDTLAWTTVNVGNQLAYTVPAALVPGATYDLQIYATTVNGDGPAAASTFVARAVPADAPTDLTVGGMTAGGALLQWAAPVNNGGANITDYRVEWSNDGLTTWHVFTHPVSSATSLYVSGLAANSPYAFRVSALNSAGTSTPTQTYAFGTTRLVPGPISGLVTAAVHGTEVELSWNPPPTPDPLPANYSPVSDYRVEVSTDGIHYTYYNHDASPSTTMWVSGLSLATDYWMRVTTFNGAYSAPSQPIAFTTTNVAGAPTAVRATPRGTGAVLSWTAPVDDGGETISDYAIRYRLVGAPDWTTVTHVASPATNALVLGLVHTTIYEVQIATVNINGAGDWSASVGFRTLAVAPGAPTRLAPLSGNAAIQVSWVSPADDGGAALTQFEVQRRLVGGVWASGGTVNGATAKLIVAQRLRNGSAYELRVRARNAIGWGPYSTSVTATTKLVPVMPNRPLVQALNRGVLISWLLPGDTSPAQKPTRVLVQRSTNGTTWTTVYNVLPIVQQVPVIGLTNGVPYQFRLVSVNALGQSIPSPVTVVTPHP
jgi:hypothetical protein